MNPWLKFRFTCYIVYYDYIDLLEHVANPFDTGAEVILSCCDLGKFFDCVEHRILLNKLEVHGIRGPVYNSLNLTSRTDDSMLGRMSISCSVPQGSIFGPCNDMSYNISDARMIMYTDDTSLLVRGRARDKLKADACNTIVKANAGMV